jgi:hypothetical protein
VELQAYTDADLTLTEALETDPEVMRELGGPIEREKLPEIHRRRLADPWWFKIVAEPKAEPRFASIHAFPPVTNAPSNALCRKFGFALACQGDFVYSGRTLHCNHWVLDTPG